jgi:DNA-binding transcriptional ArsR family regulator
VPDVSADAVELTDPRAIRAIAHPARLVVIEALYDQGRELTATQAAQLAGTTPSAMSYHLRALERYGIVRRVASAGDARERPWTRAARDLRIRPPIATSSRALTLATSAVLSTAMDVTRERLLTALERVADKDLPNGPLDDAIGYLHTSVLVTPEEAKALLKSINELAEPLQFERRTDAPQGASRLTLVIASVPDVGDPTEEPAEHADEARG